MRSFTVILFNLLFFVSTNGFSQQSLTFSGNNNGGQNSGYFTKYVPDRKYDETEGSPYLFENWNSAIVKLENGDRVTVESCKYDVFEDKIMFLQDDIPLYFSNPEDIDRFSLGSSEFINLKLKKNGGIYEILVEEIDFVLLKKFNCDIIKGKVSDGINQATKDKFKLSFNYYLIRDNVELITLKTKEKHMLKLLNNKEVEIKAYVKENNLKFSKEEDLIEIFKFYSTLL